MADPRQLEDGLVAHSIPGFCGWNRGAAPPAGDSLRGSLSLAVKQGQLDYMRELLKAGACTEQVDEIGLTPLLAATRAGNTAAIAVLVEGGADINSYGHTMWTALHFAAHLGDAATIEALVTRGGDVTARTILKGKSPLHIAAGHAETRAVQELVLRWGADETQLDGRGRSASDIAGALKNVFERGHQHAEQVERIKAVLASAPADRRWIRRRAVVMLVSRLRKEIARERSRQAESCNSGAKKRGSGGGGLVDGVVEVPEEAPPPPVAPASAPARLHAKVVVAVVDKGAPGVCVKSTISSKDCGLEMTGDVAAAAASAGERRVSLPDGMESFRDAVVRLAGEENEGVFRSVVGFL